MSSSQGNMLSKRTRIPMADLSNLTAAQGAVLDKIISGKRGKIDGPLRVVLHSPELADRWQALGEFLRFDTALPELIVELAIITTGRYWNCQLEWVVHSAIAAEAGLAVDIIESIRTAQTPVFDDPLQKSVYDFTRELLALGRASDGVYNELLGAIGAAALVELTAVTGYYSMVAMTLNAHHVPLPETENSAPLDLPKGDDMYRPTILPLAVLER